MKTESFKKTKEELQEELEKNSKKIVISDERKRMAKVNQFENKLQRIFTFSMFPYIGLLFIILTFASNGTNIIPVESLLLITTGSSLGLGIIGEKIFDWKLKIKERFKSYKKAKKQHEIMEEEIKYAIELEKANNRNKAIKETMNSLRSNQLILDSLSNRYDISDKSVPQTIEESKKIVEDLSILLNKNYSELDRLSTQKVLHDKFWKIRTKGQSLVDIIESSLMGGLTALFYFDMPLIIMGITEVYTGTSFLPTLLYILAPPVAGIITSGGYMIKRNKDYIKAFNNLNKNTLPEKIKDPREEQLDINAKIKNKIEEISVVGFHLQEQKRIMESFEDNGTEKERKLEPERTKNTEHSQEDLIEFTDEDIFDGEELDSPKEKGRSFVLRRKQ